MIAIPKRIHFCWFGGKKLPPMNVRCVDSWKRVMPDFEIVRWDETNTDLTSPFLRNATAKKQWAFVSDFVRLRALRDMGGIYFDADIEAVRSFDPLCGSGGCFIGYEARGRLGTAVLGSVAGHSFFSRCMEFIDGRFAQRRPYLIGPEVATKVAEAFDRDASFRKLPAQYFYPYNPYDDERPVKTLMYADVGVETFAIHHWGKAWSQSLLSRVLKRIL